MNTRAETESVEILIGSQHDVALNAEGAPPAYIMLVPAGAVVPGNDGRSYKNPDPQSVVDAFARDGKAVPIDINHAQFLKAPAGEPSPAAGWIEALELRDGAIWGRVEWTQIGLNALKEKTYRYVSPALKAPGGVIAGIAGAGLVNRPNLKMPSLNGEGSPSTNKELAGKLGLKEGASMGEIIAAVDALQLNAGAPDSLSLAIEQHNAAIEKLNARETADREEKTTALIESAIRQGKITPATKAEYISLCATDAGLELVKGIIAKQPAFFTVGKVVEDKKSGGGDVELNAEVLAIAEQMGTSMDALKEVIAEQNAKKTRHRLDQ